MITTMDKAIAMFILAVAFIINNFTSFHFAMSEDTANAIGAALMPIITWAIPNKTT